MHPQVSVVAPLYNEEQVFPQLRDRLSRMADSLPFVVEFVLVDDGSTDGTAHLMQMAAMEDSRYKAVFLSRNFGHQIAVTAGMSNASATQAVMIIDGDLQDPPELLLPFYEKMISGNYEVIFAVRKKRKENWMKKSLYWMFYRFLNTISEITIPLDSGDFCLISRRVNDLIVAMPEQSRFIRGMRTWTGFKQFGYEYEREKRAGGDPKYTFKKLFQLAYDGIFNFSYIPLRVITRLGFYSIMIALVYLTYVIGRKLIGYEVPSGFTTLIFAIVLFSGVQLICLGIIGEYVARIYMQVKNRPLFIISRIISNKKEH